MPSISTGIKAVQQLGLRQVIQYAWYRFGLWSGYLRWASGRAQRKVAVFEHNSTFDFQFPLPNAKQLGNILGEEERQHLLAQAHEIVSGRMRLFNHDPVSLQDTSDVESIHWTEYEHQLLSTQDERDSVPGSKGNQPDDILKRDIRYVWESGRLGWAYPLARAYLVSGDETFAASFWEHTETFLRSNPPDTGPHWVSAQEVALRLLALCFAGWVIGDAAASSPARMHRLAAAIAAHAARIPPTFSYARAQNNNHLLSESAGLYTAGCALPDHPLAKHWRELGWRLFIQGLNDQVSEDGAYIQHSTNYHRMMLQLALWVHALARSRHVSFPGRTMTLLQAATHWLYAMLDAPTGRVPNLGPNDGAYILPLSACTFDDYRPVLQAAGEAFLNGRLLESGSWDEMCLWLNPEREVGEGVRERPALSFLQQLGSQTGRSPHVLRSPGGDSWAYLRAAHFTSRPGHADQLHLDLWWQGVNVARDPGTYLYNAPPPWDNALAHTEVHNTVTVNGMDQMAPAGRFLFLDWAQAEILEGTQNENGTWRQLAASHDGYKRFGVKYQRKVIARDDGTWLVDDRLAKTEPAGKSNNTVYTICLQWLLPDWAWDIEGTTIKLQTRGYLIHLDIIGENNRAPVEISLVRAGETLYGSGTAAHSWGWYSPTYSQKVPALSLRATVAGELPITLSSKWAFFR